MYLQYRLLYYLCLSMLALTFSGDCGAVGLLLLLADSIYLFYVGSSGSYFRLYPPLVTGLNLELHSILLLVFYARFCFLHIDVYVYILEMRQNCLKWRPSS